jgi:SAM-dependent methyltransferase
MSIFGRNLIDKFKTTIPRLTFPVPPYGEKKYWDKVYQTLGVQDVYEWGDIQMDDLHTFHYRKIYQNGVRELYGVEASASASASTRNGGTDSTESIKEEFHQAIRVPVPVPVSKEQESRTKPSILILGCGNSNLGAQIHNYYTSQTNNTCSSTSTNNVNDNFHNSYSSIHLTQCDVSPNVIQSMSTRYNNVPDMSFVEVDATCQDLDSKSFHQLLLQHQDQQQHNYEYEYDAVVDKGLMDALSCSNRELMPFVMRNVHRCLKPDSAFVFLSFSRPEYLLEDTLVQSDLYQKHQIRKADIDDGEDDGEDEDGKSPSTWGEVRRLDLWSHVDVLELDSIFMYRFVKKDVELYVKDGLLMPLESLPSLHRKS